MVTTPYELLVHGKTPGTISLPWLAATPQRIEAAAVALGIEPAFVINSVKHYSDDQVDAIWQELCTGSAR